MGPTETLAVILAILFFATVIRSTFGFGEALIAVPLLAFVIPVDVAAPVATLVSVTVAFVTIARDWRSVHLRAAICLIVFTLPGICVGLWMLTSVNEELVKAILGAIIVLFSSYCLIHRAPIELKNDNWAWLFGFFAGVMGGAYGMNGPPLVIYGSLRRWSPEYFRATLQGYFLPASAAGMIGYWAKGKWTLEVSYYFAVSLPVVAIAILVGRMLQRRLHGNRFLVFIHAGLIAVGAALLIQAAWQ